MLICRVEYAGDMPQDIAQRRRTYSEDIAPQEIGSTAARTVSCYHARPVRSIRAPYLRSGLPAARSAQAARRPYADTIAATFAVHCALLPDPFCTFPALPCVSRRSTAHSQNPEQLPTGSDFAFCASADFKFSFFCANFRELHQMSICGNS